MLNFFVTDSQKFLKKSEREMGVQIRERTAAYSYHCHQR